MLRLDRTFDIFELTLDNVRFFCMHQRLPVDLSGLFQYGLFHWVALSFLCLNLRDNLLKTQIG